MTDPTARPQPAAQREIVIPAGVLRSKAAIRRDLPELLARRRNRGKWVLYHGDVRIAIGDYWHLIDELNRLNIPDDGYFIARIRPGAASDEEEDVSR